MTLKDQWNNIKNNWLIVVILIVLVLIVPLFSGSSLGKIGSVYTDSISQEGMAIARNFVGGYIPAGEDFAPEVSDRILTKTAQLNAEVERGQFFSADTQLKSIISITDSFLLNENVQKYGRESNSYYQGNYQIKVETTKYLLVVDQLKELGEVEFFNENTQDITGRYTNLQTEIIKEKERLQRYEQMYGQAVEISDRIQLSDYIFNQERKIEQLEQYLNDLDRRVDFSTISVTLTEERSSYAGLALVKFSELVRKLLNSFNGLLELIFAVFPYLILAGVVWLGIRVIKRRK